MREITLIDCSASANQKRNKSEQSRKITFFFRLFEGQILTNATCWYGELFPLAQAQNLGACWPLAGWFLAQTGDVRRHGSWPSPPRVL